MSLGPRFAFSQSARDLVVRLAGEASVRIDGPEPWDIRVKDERFFEHVARHGSLGLGEAYVAGWWDCDAVDELIFRLLRANLQERLPLELKSRLIGFRLSALASHSIDDSRRDISEHYDRSNDMFAAMLGRTMAYSCAYWPGKSDLDEAQDAKHELICRKLHLRAGDRVLDIGCGWGSFARYAAATHGASVVGITISGEQESFARDFCRGLDVEIHNMDYRSSRLSRFGRFDKIVSIGMFEHVGLRNYRRYMTIVSSALNPGGLFVLQTVGRHASRPGDPWVNKYIFPGGRLPRITEIARASEGLLVVEDWHNLRMHYERTLKAWLTNFDGFAARCPARVDPSFRRMWHYYLLAHAGNFRTGNRNQLWQVVYSKGGIPEGYASVR